MLLLIFAALIFLVAIGWGLFGISGPAKPLGAGALGVLAALLLFASMSTVVEAKNVGVVTSFGKPVDSLTPGFSFKKPWEKVTDIDGTIQTRNYKDDSDCLYVRIGDGSRSCVLLTIRWRIVADEADTIYADYRSDNPTEEVGSKLVSPQLKSALQKTLSDYNPVANLKVVEAGSADKAPSFAPDYDAMSKTLLEDLQGRSDLVEILDVSVTYVSISKNTQAQLDDFVKALGSTVVAQQNKITSKAQAEANAALEKNVSPELNVARCIDALNKAIEKGYGLPAGFNCLGGGSVVIPAK